MKSLNEMLTAYNTLFPVFVTLKNGESGQLIGWRTKAGVAIQLAISVAGEVKHLTVDEDSFYTEILEWRVNFNPE